MKKFALMLAVLLSCTNEDKTTSTLEAEGFKNITTTGYSWRSCSDSDSTCTGFEATSPSGKHVTGAVGCGRDLGCGHKGCTVRLD